LSDTLAAVARLTATEVARRFSDVLNRVAKGEEIQITRNGAEIAVLTPPRIRLLPGQRLGEILRSLPPVDDEFAVDLRRIRREAGAPDSHWPS
jgi:prevent-host-death family protein